jgi:glycosyltransferase involved in cell wall biosynthesis
MHASKMDPRKRPLDIVASAVKTVRSCARIRYVLVGEGVLSREVKEACRRLGIADRFRFLGWVPYERMPSLFNLADLVVQPSEGEGLSRVYLEAMACGRLLVASDIPAAREAVRHKENGLLFRMGDVEQLSAATMLAAEDVKLRATLGQAARQSVAAHSLPAVADQYVKLFGDVIARHGERRVVRR